MKKTNTIIVCGIAKPWLNALKLLQKDLGLEPVYYIAWRKDLSRDELQQNFPDCFYQTVEDAWKGRGFPDVRKYPLDEKILKSVAQEELIFLKMLDRLDPDGSAFSFTHRQYFFYDLLSTWLQIIQKNDIRLIISPSVPHRGFDYALYIAAKIRGIEFIMFQMTPFCDSSFLLDTIDQTPAYMKKDIPILKDKGVLRKDIENKIIQTTSAYDNAKPHYMVQQQKMAEKYSIFRDVLSLPADIIRNFLHVFSEHKTYRIKAGFMPKDSRILVYQFFLKTRKWRIDKEKLRKTYEKLCTKKINKKYIFFALHYQPEETSCPTGGCYSDQLLIIEILNSFLDSDIDIVVKEHKTQFFPYLEGEAGRDLYFYKRLSGISKRVKLVSINEDPFRLIDGAIATVTISGTIGWESVIRGTPSIIFGRAWYEDMPGVYKVKSLEDLISVWQNLIHEKNNIFLQKIMDYHRALQHFLIDAPHYKGRNHIERSVEESANNIYNGIRNHLIRKGWMFNYI